VPAAQTAPAEGHATRLYPDHPLRVRPCTALSVNIRAERVTARYPGAGATRTIAATFYESAAAELARRRLVEDSIGSDQIAVAPAVVADSDDTPIDHQATIVAVLVDGDGSSVRDVLESSGGYVVADRELDL
jgi:hypothetical protein